MVNCIIIEDQPPAQLILKKYINDTPNIFLKSTFADAIEAKKYLNNNQIDLIFLDIHLPKMTGIDFLKSMKHHPQVILTTAFSDYALESYQFNVLDYLLKPFSFERYQQAIRKLNSLKTQTNLLREPIYIKQKSEVIKLDQNNILVIKSDADYTEVLTSNKKYLTSFTLKEWIHKLDTQFCQVHKSYIINTDHFNKLSKNKIILSTLDKVPLGRSFKKAFIEKYIRI